MKKRLTIGVILVVVVAAAGCATQGKVIDAGKIVAPDGSVRWTHGSIIQVQGTQIVRSTTEQCEAARDAAGKVIPDTWVNCNQQDHPASTTAAADSTPGVKIGQMVTYVGNNVVVGASLVLSAEQIKKGMIGAAKARQPDIQNIKQEANPKLEANPVIKQEANPKLEANPVIKNCAGTTGVVDKNADVKICP